MNRSSPQYPSLDLVRAELDQRMEEQARKAAAFDVRGGLVLGFGGVLIGLIPADPTAFHVVGQLVAASAAAMAGWGLRYRVSTAVGPKALRDRYLTSDPELTKLRLLDTRIFLFEQDEERFESKVRAMKWAVWLLATAVALLLIGGIVEYVQTWR